MWRVAVIGNRRGIEPDNMFICKFCGKICQNPNSLRNHERTCRSNPEWNPHAFKCQYCGREFPRKNYLTQHEPHCSHNPEYTPYPSWIRGLTKETDSRVKRQSESRKQIYETIGGTFKGRQHTSETKNKMRQIALENENESHFGRREWFTYKDKKFISSYEVKVAQELDEHGILWEQPHRLPYIDANGKTHHYIPDFYLPTYNVYLDPKNDYLLTHINPKLGYRDVDKICWVEKQNNVRIIVLTKEQLCWEEIKSLIEGVG